MKNFFFFFLFLIVYSQIPAQTNSEIRNLVFEGAGIRGIAYCGAIQELESRNLVSNIERVSGTSAGAIVALMVALGYSGKEIEELIAKTNFKNFNDGRYIFIGGINRLNKYFGWYRGKTIEAWLEKIIEQKTNNADISFQELHQKGFKDLYITGTCLNKQKLIVFSYQSYPNMKVKDAVRISTSIPLYFEAIFINANGGIIHHPKQKQELDVMVDGGFTGNFPIHIFDTMNKQATIGFRIDSDDQITNDKQEKDIAGMPIGNLKQYLNAFYNIVIEDLNRQQLTKEDWQRTVSISDGSIGPRIRKLSQKEINILIENGRMAMKNYLN
ncbi:MAG TPA: patatin-like phospholipase family protein [Chitinophagaceae bacterium]|jgi:NTE family protein|nr:patatin-like phospholipase family protein [Chitinophagaceae bacterium]